MRSGIWNYFVLKILKAFCPRSCNKTPTSSLTDTHDTFTILASINGIEDILHLFNVFFCPLVLCQVSPIGNLTFNKPPGMVVYDLEQPCNGGNLRGKKLHAFQILIFIIVTLGKNVIKLLLIDSKRKRGCFFCSNYLYRLGPFLVNKIIRVFCLIDKYLRYSHFYTFIIVSIAYTYKSHQAFVGCVTKHYIFSRPMCPEFILVSAVVFCKAFDNSFLFCLRHLAGKKCYYGGTYSTFQG